MESGNYGGARDYFEQYLETDDTQYEAAASYYTAKCGLILYHLDGEKLMNDFIEGNPHSAYSDKAYLEMGEYFFQDRNYKQAIAFLSMVDQKVVPRKQKDEVRYKLGYSYFATKKFNEALIQFNAIKKGKSEYSDPAKYYAGFIEYDKQLYDAALADYLAIQNNKAFASTAPYMITSIYYKSNRYNDLISYAKPVLDSKKAVQKKGQIAILLAESYYGMEQYSDAYYYFDLANKKEKFTAQSVFHFGIASKETGNRNRAITLIKSIAGQNNRLGALASFELAKLYMDADNTEFAFTAIKAVKDSKYANELKESSSFMAGKLAYDLGRYSECISIIGDFRNDFSESDLTEDADNLLTQAFLNTRNYQSALTYIAGLENKSNTVWQAYQQATYYHGVGLYNNRKFAEAISYFEKSLGHPLNPKYTLKANLWLGEAYSIGRKYKAAQPFYVAAIEVGKDASEADFWKARYGRGYTYYNTGEYDKALKDFKAFVENVGKDDNSYGNALVRLADCYYVNKEYQTALNYFGQAIRSIVNEKDYAYYQTGVINGILDNYSRAIDNLDRVINVYKTSAYYDDALFEKGLLQLKKENYVDALFTLDKLIKEKNRSPYVAFALERSAVANFNLGQYENTINLYKRFINTYPNNQGVSDALIGLQDALNLVDRGDEFEPILSDFRAKNPEISGLEKVEFESLKSLYNNQEYEKAAIGLTSFMQSYPEDINTTEARYILAESLYRTNKPNSALKEYYKLYKSGEDIRVHQVAERIADIEFANGNYTASNQYYGELIKVAASNNQKLRAWMGLMNGHFNLGEFNSTIEYCSLLLENGGKRSDFIVAAHLKKGLSYINLGQYENALLSFETTTKLAKDKNAAEAQYYIGVILNHQGDYTNSSEALYVLPEQYGNYSEWLDKGFLLVAENFIALKEYYQAKATLQSIIDYSDDKATVAKATERHEWVSNEEAREANILPDSLNTVEIDTSSNQNE